MQILTVRRLRSPQLSVAWWLAVVLAFAPARSASAATAGHLTQLTFEAASDTVNPNALPESSGAVGPCTRATTGCASGTGCYHWNPVAQPCNVRKSIPTSPTVVRAFVRMRVTTYPTPIFPAYPETDVFSLNEGAFGTGTYVQFTNTNQLRLWSYGSGGLSDVCGPLSTPISLNTWYGLQLRAQKSDTATVSLDLLNDAGSVLDSVSCTNQHAGGGAFGYVMVGTGNGFGANGDLTFDDVDIHNDTGWPGNVRWVPFEPTDNASCGGTMTGCSGSGNQWQCVDENPPSDGSGTYITAQGTACRFKHADAASRGIRNPIHATLLWWNAKGDTTLAGRIDGADVDTQSLTSSFADYFSLQTTYPGGSTPWTLASVDDATFGYHRIGSGTALVTADRLIVGYEQSGFGNPNGSSGDEFGRALGTAAGYVAVGAPGQSRVYLYDHTSRALLRVLDSPTGSTTDRFGAAVVGIAHEVFVGAPLADTVGGTDAGAVYVFDGLTGALLRTIVKTSGAAGDHFGVALAAYNDNLVVGADGDDVAGTNNGAVFLYAAGGTLRGTFHKPVAGVTAFGSVVGVTGTYIMAGDPADGTGGSGAGAVHVFDGNFFSSKYLQRVLSIYNPDPQNNDAFGSAVGGIVATDPTKPRFVIGAPGDNTNATDAGSAYYYDALRWLGPGETNPNPTWGQLKVTIRNPFPASGDRFGSSITDLRGRDALIGAPYDDTTATDAGSAYLYNLNGSLVTTYANPTSGAGERFGASLAGGRHLLVGAFNEGATAAPGSAHVFEKAFPTCGVSGSYAQIGAWSALEARPAEGVHSILTSEPYLLFWGAPSFSGQPSPKFSLDPSTGEVEAQDATSSDLFCAGHSILADGNPIVVGGTYFIFNGMNETWIWDQTSETWTQGASMAKARWYPTATTLQDGRVLAMSGQNAPNDRTTVPEIYDPALDTWTALPTATLDRDLYPFMFQLPNGKVLQAGADGASDTLTHTIDLSQASPTWTVVGNSTIPGGSAAMYRPGKVMKSGGTAPPSFTIVSTAERIDMTAATPAWTTTSSMAYPRLHHNLVILADGSVFAVGGVSGQYAFQDDQPGDAVMPTERWDPNTGTWSTTACIAHPRMYHSSAVLLPDARVLVQGGNFYPSAQVYSPPYLFAGARPTITSAPATVGYNANFTVQTPSTGIASVALIRPGAATHAFDQNQRYVPLTFTTTAGGLTVTSPLSGAWAPPGDYMLFISTTGGVPSVAKFIRLG